MFKFVGNDKEGRPLKRRQAQRACHECRKRKKRCPHLDTNDRHEDRPLVQSGVGVSTSSRPQTSLRSSTAPSVTSQNGDDSNNLQGDALSVPQPENQTMSILREDTNWHDDNGDDHPSFIGDLNPEGILLTDRSPSTTGPATDSAGTWLQRRSFQIKASYNHRNLDSLSGKNTLLSKLVVSYLGENCLRQLPSKDDYEALRSIYIDHIHTLYPILDISGIPVHSDDSPLQIMLKQAICLAASTTPLAKPHLKLPLENGGWALHSPRDFASQISTSLRTSIYLGLVRNRICMLQIFSLLSLFTQFADDRHSSAEAVASAVSYLHTIGLHLETQDKRTDHEFVTRLFCCVWLLDRLNAAFHGRPVLMHERDFGRDLEKCFSQQKAEFQLFLRVALLLDQVIALYRPAINENSTRWDEGFPAFEDLIHQSGASGVRSGLLATIETFYHAVSMLTYRSKSMVEVVRSSASFARQTLSATAVTHIVATEYRGQLSMLPIVPYAVSLALRCAYRELRLSKSTYNRDRAKRQLTTSCDILRDLSEIFPAAMSMVELADQTLREMDKVVSSIRNTQQHSTKQHQAHGGEEETAGRHHDSQPTAGITATNGSPSDQAQSTMPLAMDSTNIGTDVDIFDYFDPNFDLDAIDAMLGDSIELSFPYFLSSPEM